MVQLKEFSFIAPKLEAGVVFKPIETVISPEVIEQTLGKTHSFEERKRQLPSSLVVCLVIATRKVGIGFNGRASASFKTSALSHMRDAEECGTEGCILTGW